MFGHHYYGATYFAPAYFGPSNGPPPAVPSVPSGLSAAGGVARVDLSWAAAAGAATYSVFRGTTPGGESGTAVATGVATTTYADTGRAASTTYYYTVKAVNAGGASAASGEASATTTARALTASPRSLRPGDTGKTITLTDNYGAATPGTPGTPTVAVSKAATNDAVKNSQTVVSATVTTVNVDAGASLGTITFNPGTGFTATVAVSLAGSVSLSTGDYESEGSTSLPNGDFEN